MTLDLIHRCSSCPFTKTSATLLLNHSVHCLMYAARMAVVSRNSMSVPPCVFVHETDPSCVRMALANTTQTIVSPTFIVRVDTSSVLMEHAHSLQGSVQRFSVLQRDLMSVGIIPAGSQEWIVQWSLRRFMHSARIIIAFTILLFSIQMTIHNSVPSMVNTKRIDPYACLLI